MKQTTIIKGALGEVHQRSTKKGMLVTVIDFLGKRKYYVPAAKKSSLRNLNSIGILGEIENIGIKTRHEA